MKKIRSGQAYLYRKGGLKSTVFEMRMHDKIRGDFLRRAYEMSLQRYPYFKSKLVEKEGDFYLADNLLSIAFAKTDQFRPLGSMQVNYHLLDVTYFEKTIRVAFHHALCDGRGIKPFLETLLYYYCCLRYNKKFAATNIRLAEDDLLPKETAEPFGDTTYEVGGKCEMPHLIKDGFHIPESEEKHENTIRYEVRLDAGEFIKKAKEEQATPAILIAIIMSKAIKASYEEFDKPIVCNMASDMRTELGMENTHKNCVGSLYFPYEDVFESQSLSDIATSYRTRMKEQKNPDLIRQAANQQIMLSNHLDQAKSLKEKQEMLHFFNDLCLDTFVISYIGRIELGEYDQYVDSIHLYSSGTRGLILNMVATKHTFTIDLLQSFKSDTIKEAFVKNLKELGLHVQESEGLMFDTVPDQTYRTGKWQAEKYLLR